METPNEIAKRIHEFATNETASLEWQLEMIELEVRIIKSQAVSEYLEEKFKEK